MANNTALITWNANSEPDLAGYKIYYGQQPGPVFIGSVSVGLVTQVTLQGEFNNDGTWNFAISAFDTSLNESALSSPVSKRIVRTQANLIRRK